MSIRTPNPEQKLAIEHNGGVLLSAGAGSGKTFVLVEHIIYLLKEFRGQLDPATSIDLEIKKYLSSIVMMTFTKKAAGEMSTRLYKRIQAETKASSDHQKFWEAVGRNLNSLFVSTIHGFCYKLIAANFFPELRSTFDIIDSDSQKTKLEELFDDWYLLGKGKRSDYLNQIILSHRKQVLGSVFEIFSSPDLRDLWKNSLLEQFVEIDMSNTMSEILESEDWGHVVSDRFDLSPYEDKSTLSWYKNLKGFTEVVRSQDWDNVNYWVSLNEFFAAAKPLKDSGKKDPIFEVNEYYDAIKEFRKFIARSGESIISFLNNKDHFKSWVSEFYNLFHFIESRYDKLGGLTFSDLEYYVLKGLEGKPWAIKKIGEQYKYFIVDEFQDTSEVQFEILKNLVNKDFSKLFCVGDVKQAIYGFRGGELGVFKACSNEVPEALSLSKNYRSEEKLINLNNTLFDHLFKVGVNYSGVEKSPIEVEYQEYPGDAPNSGELNQLKLEVQTEGKISSRDMDFMEAEELFKKIEEKAKLEDTIGILYKNLGASAHLIPKLIDSGLSFTAQVKIPMKEGPLWALFSTLLEGYLDNEENQPLEKSSFVVHGILSWLGSKIDLEGTTKQVERFYSNVGLAGFVVSFEIFIGEIGISDSDYEKNFSKINHLNELAGEDPEKLYNLLYEFGPERTSVEFRYGENSDRIFLMTAHGSKGLEFDHVFIGGIHTNGRKNSDSPLLGKLPGSVKWKLNPSQKEYFKSPKYLLEEIRMAKKDFAESKRLFYVACTRAQKSLSWVDLSRDLIGLKYSADSWINGMRLYEEIGGKESSFQKGEINTSTHAIEFDGRKISDDVKPPLFQSDNLGIIFKSNNPPALGLLAEVSVTRLATLAQCPRKFYLSNICKLDEEDLERLEFGNEIKINDEKTYKEEVEDIRPIKNTRERGIFIHDAISRAIGDNLKCPEDVEAKDRKSVEYPLELLKEKSTYSLLSEVPVKFPLFGQMISGTPDLVLLPESKNQVPEVWDYKTGTQKESSELAYWFQLYCYAIQTCLQMGLSNDDKVKVALVYVDERKFVEKVFSKKEIEELLYDTWKNLGNFNQVNTEYCNSCSFGKLCQIRP